LKEPGPRAGFFQLGLEGGPRFGRSRAGGTATVLVVRSIRKAPTSVGAFLVESKGQPRFGRK
jgi:hypothetical protein